jgi:hypothetical protein
MSEHGLPLFQTQRHDSVGPFLAAESFSIRHGEKLPEFGRPIWETQRGGNPLHMGYDLRRRSLAAFNLRQEALIHLDLAGERVQSEADALAMAAKDTTEIT